MQPASESSKSMAAQRTRKTKTVKRVDNGRESELVPKQSVHLDLLNQSDTRSKGLRHTTRAACNTDTASVKIVPSKKPGSVRPLMETQPGFAMTGGAELKVHESRRFPEMPALPALVRITVGIAASGLSHISIIEGRV